MPRSSWSVLSRVLRRAAPAAGGEPLTDAELLSRFAATADQAAFELLFWRHGPMVLGTCRRVLRDDHAAEDAFQATFLILARKAGSVRGGSLAGWLHRVARRVSMRLAKQRRPLAALVETPADAPTRPDAELQALLDAEINRLPDRFRRPVVLCYLEGRSATDAATILGVPRGTVLSRLATARERLAARLTRRGVTVSAGGLFLAVSTGSISADLVHTGVAAAMRFAARSTLAVGPAVHLAEGVLRMGTRTLTACWAAALLATAGLGTGLAVMADGGGDEPKSVVAAPKPQPAPAAPLTPPRDASSTPAREARQRLEEQLATIAVRAQETEFQLRELEKDRMDPHLAKAKGEVLTQIELSHFKTQMERRELDGQLADKREKLKAVEAKPLKDYGEPRFTDAAGTGMTPAGAYPGGPAFGGPPGEYHSSFFPDAIRQKEDEVAALAARTKAESPALREARAQLAKLRDSWEKEKTRITDEFQKAEQKRARQAVEGEIRSLEGMIRQKDQSLDLLRGERADILNQLAKADDFKRRRHADELDLLREQSAQVRRALFDLELSAAKGAAPAPAGTPDAKLDQVLSELAALRGEVRRLQKAPK